MTLEKLKKLIIGKKIDVLFFDIFDTLILREVHPEYVKKIFAKYLKEKYCLQESVLDIYLIRNKLEASLCEKNESLGYDQEFQYFQLIDEMYKILIFRNSLLQDVTFEEFYNTCKELELNVEKKVQKIDKNVLDLAKLAKKYNIQVVCVSDFYLDKNMLIKLFEHHKIINLFDNIFVSSEFLLTKRSGRLFSKLLEEYYKNQSIVMIGDNKYSDYEIPKQYGIKSLLLDRKRQFSFYKLHEKRVNNKKYIENIIEEKLLAHNQVYFKEMSLTLFYFCYKLYMEIRCKKIQNIFFLSREGEFLKKVFDEFLKRTFLNGKIKTHYLLVSRKSTFICSLQELEKENFETLFRQYREMSALDFLKNLNFNEKQISSIAHYININKVYDNFPVSKTFEKLKKLPIFQEYYEQNRIEQKNNFIKYLESFKCNIEDGITLVDVGWKGTIQDHIYKILDCKVNIYGFYIGLVADLMPEYNNIKKGLIFDYRNKNKAYNVFSENTALYEVLLGASHGSANSYKDINGTIQVITSEEKKEKKIFIEYIRPIQEEIFFLIKFFIDIFCVSHYELIDIERYIISKHTRMVYYPLLQEIQFFKKLYHFENFGKFKYSEFSNQTDKNILFRIKNLIRLIKQPRETLNSGFWKAVTFDDMGLFILYPLYVKYREYKTFEIKKLFFQQEGKNTELILQLKDCHKAVKNQDQLIEERDRYIKELELKLNKCIEAVKNQDQLIEERDRYIKELELKLNKCIEAVKKQDKLVLESDIAQLEKSLKEIMK